MNPDPPVHLERRLEAPPAAVFEAFLDPDALARWFVPGTRYSLREASVDAQPGGSFRLAIDAPEGGGLDIAGRYREIEAPTRLVFTWSLAMRAPGVEDTAPEPGAGDASIVTIDLADVPDGGGEAGAGRTGGTTRLTLTHEGMRSPEERAEYEGSWSRLLEQLAVHVASDADAWATRNSDGPRYPSPFGGTWPDLSHAEALIDGKLELRTITEEEADRLRSWRRNGYTVLEGAVPPETIDAVRADLEAAWSAGAPGLFVEHYSDNRMNFEPIRPEHRDIPHKVLDFHGFSEPARQAIFSPPIRRFLELLFERPAMAFQSLVFSYGTEQDMHQDTAFVVLRSPLEFTGLWIALEDIEEGTGELQYYEGSHRIPQFLWEGKCRAMPPGTTSQNDFLRWMVEKPEELGCPLRKFTPRKGDALVWHADLVHGGSPVTKKGHTRRSLVTHLCPVDNDPAYAHDRSTTGKVRHDSGGYIVHVDRRETAG